MQSETIAKTQWIMGSALVAIVAGLYFFGYRPAANRIASLQQETFTRTNEFEAAEMRARDLKTVELEVERLKTRLERFDKQLPSVRDAGTEGGVFIGDITQLSQRGSIRGLNYQKAGIPKRSEYFTELPYYLNFQGDFPSVAAFLQQMELMPRLARVMKLQLKTKDEKMGQVEVQVSMNLFFSNE